MASDRLENKFKEIKAAGRTGIIPFITTGFPNIKTTIELVIELANAGADIIELGVPFSDPMADGATIQNASFHSLQQGTTLNDCLSVASMVRKAGVDTPLVLMGYYNPILAMGLSKFADKAQKSGIDAVIVADLPPEESILLKKECIPRGIDIVYLLAPTSTKQRIELVCNAASGFIYCVSVTGVTGVRNFAPSRMCELVNKVKSSTNLPVAVGFGLSNRDHVRLVGECADAAIIGSALVNIINGALDSDVVSEAVNFLKELREGDTNGS